jgi:hypothetical protein
VVRRTLWDYDRIIVLCGQGFPKKELSEKARDDDLRYYIEKGFKIDIAKQFSHISDVQAAQLFYRAFIKGENIATIYADHPFIERKFIKCIKVTFNDQSFCQDLKNNNFEYLKDKLREYGIKEEEFIGIRALSIITYMLKERKKGEKVSVCWAIKEDVKEKGIAEFISSTAFHPNDVIMKYEAEDQKCEHYDLKIEFVEDKCREENKNVRETKGEKVGDDSILMLLFRDNSMIIPFFRYIPSFIKFDSKKKEVDIISEWLDFMKKKKRTLLVTLGGPEHNVFLLYFINKFREKYEYNSRIIFDMANAWDYMYIKKGLEKRENPTVVLNSEGFITAIIKKKLDETPVEYKEEKNAVLFSIIDLKPLYPDVDLLSIIGIGKLAALFTKIGIAFIVLYTIKGKKNNEKFYMYLPGVYIIEDGHGVKYEDKVKELHLPFDDPVVMLDKVKDIILKFKPETIAAGELY